ncbi:MAG TPA: helix-turn-helix domain-containing protein [Candidatus Dormibacteraeota bacterium]|nr:helix-turn-helix domain-containing protein [Candidatus Dormibacteraeota bacterium]
MNEELVKQVEDLGLSNKEARVYLANLMLGPSGVQQIAEAAGIKRVTTYVILESLVGLGLVSQTTHAKKTLFNAEDPQHLSRLLEKREEALKEQKQNLSELLPDIKKLKSLSKDVPAVKFYEGAESMMTIYKSLPLVFKKYNVKESFGISNLDQLYASFPEIKDAQANPSRVDAKVKSRFIYTTKEGPIIKESDSVAIRESRFVPLDKFPFNCDIGIVGDFISVMSLETPRPMGITIESAALAKGFKAVFELAWEGAEKYDKENKSK